MAAASGSAKTKARAQSSPSPCRSPSKNRPEHLPGIETKNRPSHSRELRRGAVLLQSLRRFISAARRCSNSGRAAFNLAGGDDAFGRTLTNRQLDFADGARHFDFTRAGGGAVENRAAAPHVVWLGKDVQPFLGRLIARVEDKAMSLNDGRRADIVAVGPEARAGRRAAGAENALGRIVKLFAVFR